jgi:hypothetical protein
MKFDTTVKELQKEKAELEAKLKQVSAALAALTKLGGKQMAAPVSAPQTNVAPAQATPAAVKPGATAAPLTTKPFGS